MKAGTVKRIMVLIAVSTALALTGCSIHPFDTEYSSQRTDFFFGGGDSDTFFTMAAAGNTSASLWLASQMDLYHNTFDVYSDFGSGGNHFVVKALIGNTNITLKENYTNITYSGDTAIQVIFKPGTTGAGNFMTGTAQDGVTIDTATMVSSGEAIPHLAVLTLTKNYTNSLKFADANHTNGSAHRYDYNTDKDGAWMEGTAFMAMAYLYNSNITKGTNIVHGMTNGNRGTLGSVYASTKDQLTTGFVDANGSNLTIYRREQVAPTALAVILDKRKNPYWIGTASENLPGTAVSGYPSGYGFLTNKLDQYHRTFYVYRDANCGGNHFDQRGVMNNSAILNNAEDQTNVVYSGKTAIRVTLTPTATASWAGLYYMNGVMNGSERNPSANWGNFTNAGLNLTGATTLTFYARGAAGGEQVTFFTLGIARTANGGTNTNTATAKPYLYPDSSPQIVTNVKLTTTWTKYTISLTGKNLAYVLGGFGWTSANKTSGNVVFYIDEIFFNLASTAKPRLIETYTTVRSAFDFDKNMANMSYTYDNSLAALAFLAVGDNARAKTIVDALVYAQTNDRYFTDNRLRNAYMSGELTLPAGWNPNGKSNSVRSPGWWDSPHYNWFEDGMAVGSSLDANAWAMLALLSYYNKAGGAAYLDAAQKIGNWIETYLKDSRGNGGYKNGYLGWEPAQTADNGKSLMANSAVYAAFKRLYDITANSVWNTRAAYAKTYIDSMWIVGGGFYYMNGILASGSNQTSAITNWGNTANAGFNLTGATTLSFYARGASGGEKVEFFAGGIGRNSDGTAAAPYPDSFAKVSTGTITLGSTWTKYSISLSGKDLSYVIGGFGFYAVSSGTNQVTFYIDDVKYSLARASQPRFITSYTANQKTGNASDLVLKNTAFIYDQAMSILSFLVVGETARAKLVADALVYARTNDRYYTDGRMRNGYSSGDLASWPGWKPNGKAGAVRTPGWWVIESNKFAEDKYAMSTSTGNLAWVMLALLAYYQKAGGQIYLDTAAALGDWIRANAYRSTGIQGFTGGTDGWEPSPTNNTWCSTEHNLDLYAAYTRLYQITGAVKWAQYATNAYTFVTNMWDSKSNCFYMGTDSDGVTINKDLIPVDTQVWTHLALLKLKGAFTNSFAFAEKSHMITNASSQWGFDFDRDRDGIWFEGTGQMATGYMMIGQESRASNVLNAIHGIGQNANGSINAATKDQLTTGLQVTAGIMWYYYKRESVGATTWSVMADKRVNAFWIGTTNENLPVVASTVKTNTYGIYTETAAHKTVAEVPYDRGATLMVWSGTVTLTDITSGQYEGTKASQWLIGSQGWFGGGVMHSTPTNLSAFASGFMSLRVKSAGTTPVRVGLRSNNGTAQEAWVNLTFTRNNTWQEIVIPVSSFKTANANLNMSLIDYCFMVSQGGTPVAGEIITFDDVYLGTY